MVIELAADRAPVTVENFLQYVEDGFYNETIFHRVIEGFMIQGGGFNGQYRRKATRSAIPNEANNGLRNQRYTISMARTNAPHSATAQFFINTEDNRNLDHTGPTPRGNESQAGFGYCVFGKTTAGMETVQAIESVATGSAGHHQDVPVEAVVIESVTVS
ncbi:UNVERIFIED_CONTAM: hypothetical protein GTU68_044239 [Idotea baltica]|nr:hypothetical protein [Idotea baltica]